MMSRFDQIASEWDKKDIRVHIAAECAKAIKTNVELDKAMKVMDFGAGTGLLSFSIAPEVGHVVAVDTSEKMLDVLRSKNSAELSVETYHGDIMHLPLDDDFDGIVSSMAMHHVEDTLGFLKTLHAHLKPGGFIAICDLDAEDGTFHPADIEGVYHLGFDRNELATLVTEAGFVDGTFHEALNIQKEKRDYPVFMLKAMKA